MGDTQVAAPIEDVHRFYAWQRLAHYPLVVSVGLSRDQAMAGTYQSVRDSRLRNAVGTLAFVLAACWIACSSSVKSRTVNGWSAKGNVTDWHWKAASWAHGTGARLGDFFDRSWVRLLGLPQQAHHPNKEQLQALIHPEDWPAWCDALDAHVRGD